jgi:hypothetical protein
MLLVAEDQEFESILDPVWRDAARAQRVTTRWVSLVRHLLPPIGLEALDAASRRWLRGHTQPLEPLRVAVWTFLDAKHGNSTTIADDEDRAMRALLCCLYDEPDPNQLDTTLLFALDMLSATGISETQLREVVAATP